MILLLNILGWKCLLQKRFRILNNNKTWPRYNRVTTLLSNHVYKTCQDILEVTRNEAANNCTGWGGGGMSTASCLPSKRLNVTMEVSRAVGTHGTHWSQHNENSIDHIMVKYCTQSHSSIIKPQGWPVTWSLLVWLQCEKNQPMQ